MAPKNAGRPVEKNVVLRMAARWLGESYVLKGVKSGLMNVTKNQTYATLFYDSYCRERCEARTPESEERARTESDYVSNDEGA